MKINVICPVNQMGYGVTGLQTLRFLDEVGHDVTWFPIGSIPSVPDIERFEDLLKRIHFRGKDYDAGAPCYRMYHEFDSAMFPAGFGKKVTQVVFELDKISERSVHLLDQLDAVIVPSEWGAQVLRNCGVVPEIHVVPHGVDMDVFQPMPPRSLPNEVAPFTFLCVGKWEIRKSQEEIAKAFVQEFSKEEPVRLKLMCNNKFFGRSLMDGIEHAYRQSGRVIFIPWSHTLKGVAAQMQDADCGIFAPKAEGWGLPILEMMSCNRPVVTTRNTGITEYIHDSSQSITIISSGDLVEAKDGRFFFEGDGRWHHIEIDAIRHAMREAYEKGRTGNPEGVNIASKFSWHNTIEKLEAALEHIPAIEGHHES